MEEIRVLVSHCPGIPTVHSTGRSRRGTGYGFPPAIASTAPAPGRGAGEGRAARAGWGCRRGTYGYPPAGRGRPPPRSPPPVAIPPRSTAQGDPGVEPGPGSHSPPPGNQREDRSRGTAHPRIYAWALPPPLPGGVGERRGAPRVGWGEGRIGSVRLESMHQHLTRSRPGSAASRG